MSDIFSPIPDKIDEGLAFMQRVMNDASVLWYNSQIKITREGSSFCASRPGDGFLQLSANGSWVPPMGGYEFTSLRDLYTLLDRVEGDSQFCSICGAVWKDHNPVHKYLSIKGKPTVMTPSERAHAELEYTQFVAYLEDI